MRKVIPIPDGYRGCDTDHKLSYDEAVALRKSGYHFVVRYTSIGSKAEPGDIDADELSNILRAGLGSMPCQHVRNEPWRPTGPMGDMDGSWAVNHAVAAGYPSRVSYWCDGEGVDPAVPSISTCEYIDAWTAQVKAAGYLATLYVGANLGLSAAQLWGLKVTRYIKSASDVPIPDHRGFCLVQTLHAPADGIDIDQDGAMTDLLGGRAMMLVDDDYYQPDD